MPWPAQGAVEPGICAYSKGSQMPGGTVAGPRHTAKSYGPARQPLSGRRAAGGCPEAGSGSSSPLAFREAVPSQVRSGKMN